jgi:hypothetical protein
MTTVEEPPRHYGPTFWVGFVLGWSVIAFGVVGVMNSVWLKDRPAEVATWVLGGLVVHDAVLAPLVTVVALLVARLLPQWMRGPIAAALVLSGLVLLFSYPLLRAFGRREANPSILPLDYGRNVIVVVAIVWAVALAVVVVRLLRRQRT